MQLNGYSYIFCVLTEMVKYMHRFSEIYVEEVVNLRSPYDNRKWS